MNDIKKGLKLTLVLIIVCGLVYPLAVTGIGQLIFPKEANGSIIKVNDKEVGSQLIGQQFNDDKHFSGRISSAVNYNTSEDGQAVNASSGSQNLAPTSEELRKRVESDINLFIKKNPTVPREEISAELISQSASGLDPHITPRGAEIQIPRISKATGISEAELKTLVEKHTEGRLLGIYGEPRVNVLELNIELDSLANGKTL